jgi:hypothetical protein
MRRAARTDDNHADIVQALRSAGAAVQSLAAIGDGCPDLLIGYAGRTAVVEIKDGSKPPSRQRLTPAESAWHAGWTGGTLAIVSDVESAMRLLRVMAA